MKLKNYFLLTLGVVAGFGTNAQISEYTQKSHSSPHIGHVENYSSSTPSNRSSSTDTIWYDDFSVDSNWIFVGGVNEWRIDSGLTSSLIGQGFDPVIASASGPGFAFIDSDGAGNGQSQDAIIEYAQDIDCSLNPDVQLVFETYFRKFNDIREVIISGDGGITWDTLEVLTQFGASTTSSNPYTEIVDISQFAGGQSNVRLRFRYVGSFDWFWCVDDVRIQPVPLNNIELTQEYYNGVSDVTYRTYYSMIPKKQADSANLFFGGSVVNNGLMDQTNTRMSVLVNHEGVEVFNDTTLSDSLPTGQNGQYDLTNGFSPNSGYGKYEILFNAFSDSVDALPRDNVKNHHFEVSSYQYRRDNDTVNSDNWFDVSSSLEMLVRYEVYTLDSVVALSVNFPYNYITGRGLIEGDSISYYVYKSSNLNDPISENLNYIVTDDDVNSWITLPMPIERLEPGMYYVGFKLHGNFASVGTNSMLNANVSPLTVLLRTDATSSSAPWQSTTSFMPFVRMFTHTDSACANVVIGIDFSVVDSTEIGQIESNVTGTGAAPYLYAWEGPNGYTSTSQNLANIVDTGYYQLTVNDVFGCEVTDSVFVGGTVNVNELSFASEVVLFPNPVGNTLNVYGKKSVNEVYQIKVTNSLGQVLWRGMDSNPNVLDINIDMNGFETGIYFITIENKKLTKRSWTIIKK